MQCCLQDRIDTEFFTQGRTSDEGVPAASRASPAFSFVLACCDKTTADSTSHVWPRAFLSSLYILRLLGISAFLQPTGLIQPHPGSLATIPGSAFPKFDMTCYVRLIGFKSPLTSIIRCAIPCCACGKASCHMPMACVMMPCQVSCH